MRKSVNHTDIEDHVTEIDIHGWESYKNFKYENAKLHYLGVADGKRFNVVTEGNETIGNVVRRICEDLAK